MKTEENKLEKGRLDIQGEVIAAIESGKAKMRPRWVFAIQTSLIAVTTVLVGLALVYIISFIMFDLEETGLVYVPAFGLAGWYALLQSLPWILVFFCAVAILLVTILVRNYAFAYHWPALYSIVAVVCLAIGGGALVFRTPLSGFFCVGPCEHMQIFNVSRLEGVYRGQVVTAATSSFLFEDLYGSTATIIVASNTIFPDGSIFGPGDMVVVFGNPVSTNTILAAGVKKIQTQSLEATSTL